MAKLFSNIFLAALLFAISAALPMTVRAQATADSGPGQTPGSSPVINNPATGNIAPPPLDGSVPAPKPKTKHRAKKAAAKTDQKQAAFTGKLAAVDKTAMTITVEGAEQRVLKITSNTRVNKDGKPSLLADGKVGDDVSGQAIKSVDGSEEATVVNFGARPLHNASKASHRKPKKATPESLTPGIDSNQPPAAVEAPISPTH